MLVEKLQSMETLGDTYFLRRTFDIIDYRDSIYGFNIFDDERRFIMHYDIEDINEVAREMKWDIYRILS